MDKKEKILRKLDSEYEHGRFLHVRDVQKEIGLSDKDMNNIIGDLKDRDLVNASPVTGGSLHFITVSITTSGRDFLEDKKHALRNFCRSLAFLIIVPIVVSVISSVVTTTIVLKIFE